MDHLECRGERGHRGIVRETPQNQLEVREMQQWCAASRMNQRVPTELLPIGTRAALGKGTATEDLFFLFPCCGVLHGQAVTDQAGRVRGVADLEKLTTGDDDLGAMVGWSEQMVLQPCLHCRWVQKNRKLGKARIGREVVDRLAPRRSCREGVVGHRMVCHHVVLLLYPQRRVVKDTLGSPSAVEVGLVNETRSQGGLRQSGDRVCRGSPSAESADRARSLQLILHDREPTTSWVRQGSPSVVDRYESLVIVSAHLPEAMRQ